ncbi:hypothetical protein SLS60_003112 [Paraconiothyrium brasiliense]|uniref:Leucine-rich repeat domain-containing protein n=1 Tax=Paraconiothyrium brasiliense TaxID=300254 RepID=A0ABR3RV82_9PLEO
MFAAYVLTLRLELQMYSATPSNSPKLDELPGELILEILQYLTVVRGYLATPEEEAARRAENAQRVVALHGMSLACRRFNDIATPYLYESITNIGQSTNWTNVESLLNTIIKKPSFIKFIRYIETGGDEIDAALGSKLENKLEGIRRIDYNAFDYDGYVEDGMVERFPSTVVVSTLISLATNLESLAIDREWHLNVVYDLACNPALRDISLRHVYDDGGIIHISASPTKHSSSVLVVMSEIARVRVGDIWLNRLIWGGEDWYLKQKARLSQPLPHPDELRSVSIEELVLKGNMEYVVLERLLSHCTSLRRLRYHWTAASDGTLGVPIDLRKFRKRLQPFEKTLEVLALDTLDSSWLVELEEDIPTIGSLREFTNLKHVEVSGMVLWSDDDGTVKQPRLSSILPSALETLVVNVEWEEDVEEALADLAIDCKAHFPNLKKVDCSWRPAPMFVGRNLITEFERAGVNLKLDVASSTEEEEKRIEAEMIQMEQDIEYMDERAEAIEEEIRRFDQEVTRMEEDAHVQEISLVS